jgi:hypothetical protein
VQDVGKEEPDILAQNLEPIAMTPPLSVETKEDDKSQTQTLNALQSVRID